jgi:translation initiation factor eIF-2B subunit epsilon
VKGVILEAGASVIHSIVCNGATIKAGAVISRGCVVSYGVVIGEGVILPEYSRITLKKHVDEVIQH